MHSVSQMWLTDTVYRIGFLVTATGDIASDR